MEGIALADRKSHPGWTSQIYDSPLQSDHGGMGPVVGAEFGEDVFDSALDRFFSDRELIRDLLVGISGSNQTQNSDFCWCQNVIGRVAGDFVRCFGRKSL